MSFWGIVGRVLILVALSFGFVYYMNARSIDENREDARESLRQLDQDLDQGEIRAELAKKHAERSYTYIGGWILIFVVGLVLFGEDTWKMCKNAFMVMLLGLCLGSTGCWRPFQPVKLEVIQTNEEAFLLPFIFINNSDQSVYSKEQYRINLK